MKIPLAMTLHNRNEEMLPIVKRTEDKLLSATDGEWPALAHANNLKIGRVDVVGLEFETPDFNQGDIKKAGSIDKWLKEVYEADKMKKFRWKIAQETVRAAREIISRGLEQ